MNENLKYYRLLYRRIWIPILFAIPVFLIRFNCSIIFNEVVLSNALTVCSILIGFSGSIQALLLSMTDNETVDYLKRYSITSKHSYYDLCHDYLNKSIVFGLFFIAYTFIALILLMLEPKDEVGFTMLYKILTSIWVFSFSLTCLFFYHALSGSINIIKKSTKEK